jgi:hypothetical protein
MFFDQFPHAFSGILCRKPGIHQNVTTLDVRTHITKTAPHEHFPQLRHRYFVFAARHYPTQEDNIGAHNVFPLQFPRFFVQRIKPGD